MRAFIAFPISDEARKELVQKQAEINSNNPQAHIKWVEDLNMHVTVEFLGDITEVQSEHIKTILNKLCVQYKSFAYQLNKVSAFPNLQQPNVLMVDVDDDESNTSANLYEELHKELIKIDLKLNNKKWHPHVTLGRIKSDFTGKIMLSNISIQRISWTVGEILLIKSELTSTGPLYKIIQSFKLSINV